MLLVYAAVQLGVASDDEARGLPMPTAPGSSISGVSVEKMNLASQTQRSVL